MSKLGVFLLAAVIVGGALGDYGVMHHNIGPLFTGYGIAVAALASLWQRGDAEDEETVAEVVAALLAEVRAYDPDDWLAEPPSLARAALVEMQITLAVEDDGRWDLRAEDEAHADELTRYFGRNVLPGDAVGGRLSLAAA